MEQGGAFGPAEFQKAAGTTSEQMADLQAYRGLLQSWSARMNLVGPSALSEFWNRHAYDSAQLVELAPAARTWADLGSGAGLPGLVIAIFLKGRPGARVHLVESLQKRCRFLEAVVQTLELPAEVHCARAESLRLTGIDVVTARACAPLERLLGYAAPTLRSGARGLFLKGRGVDAELAAAHAAWRFDVTLIPSKSDPEGRIVAVESLARA